MPTSSRVFSNRACDCLEFRVTDQPYLLSISNVWEAPPLDRHSVQVIKATMHQSQQTEASQEN